ncbi:hypothetical protein QFC22_002374 [Naganishia vaughanmartiniae]|uniref:Uncharacterized protein n=1 Tax=Naganishia vaughanmartiniae TaxID=1424756 RepID=A0ACC2XD63_9TREE|nr:hypothetical protein QFC22_002374 [Naganishia vaughanmartiniae]
MPAYSTLTVPEYQVPGVFAGMVSPDLHMSPPPSLATGTSTWSEGSDVDSARFTLGTPRLYSPDDHHPVAGPSESRYASHSEYLQVGVEIALEPEDGNRLEMFGTSKTGTSYSIPGHVLLTVPNIPGNSFRDKVRMVKDLKVVFEGKSEFCDDAGRYHVMRIVRREILLSPDEGMKLPARDPNQPANKEHDVTVYSVSFDMIIPGWLPQTYENELVANTYGLVATAGCQWGAVARSTTTATKRSSMMSVDSDITPVLSSSAPVPIVSAASPDYSSRFFPRFAKSVANALTSAISLPHHSSSAQAQPVKRSSQWQPVEIVRHRAPTPSPLPLSATDTETIFPNIPLRHYTLKPAENSPSPVECVVSVPETIDINGPTLKVSVRLRARNGHVVTSVGNAGEAADQIPATPTRTSGVQAEQGSYSDTGRFTASLPAATRPSTTSGCRQSASDSQRCKEQIRMVELGMEVEETERYSSTPAQSFSAAFPIPEDQPDESSPHHGPSALLSPPSRLSGMSMFGLTSSVPFKGTRTRTLLLGEDGNPRTYRFEGPGLDLGEGWRKVNIIIPMPGDIESNPTMANDSNKPAVEIETPFLKIKHKLKIRIVCRSTALPGQDTIVVLTTPLRCGTAPKPRRLNLTPMLAINTAAGFRIPQPGSLFGQEPLTHLSSLPAYCQIFHENGATREDEEVLPLYSPDAPPSYDPFSHPRSLPTVAESSFSNNTLGPGSPLESSLSSAISMDTTDTTDDLGAAESTLGITADPIDEEELLSQATASDESIPSVPGPRDYRSSSPPLSDIDSNASFGDAQEQQTPYGSPCRADRAAARRNRTLSGHQDHLMSASSELSLPDCLNAARRRSLRRSKYRQPSSSSLSRSTPT